MTTRFDTAAADDAMKVGEADAPVDAWTLDELDEFGELGSLRSAWTSSDDFAN